MTPNFILLHLQIVQKFCNGLGRLPYEKFLQKSCFRQAFLVHCQHRVASSGDFPASTTHDSSVTFLSGGLVGGSKSSGSFQEEREERVAGLPSLSPPRKGCLICIYFAKGINTICTNYLPGVEAFTILCHPEPVSNWPLVSTFPPEWTHRLDQSRHTCVLKTHNQRAAKGLACAFALSLAAQRSQRGCVRGSLALLSVGALQRCPAFRGGGAVLQRKKN